MMKLINDNFCVNLWKNRRQKAPDLMRNVEFCLQIEVFFPNLVLSRVWILLGKDNRFWTLPERIIQNDFFPDSNQSFISRKTEFTLRFIGR